MNALEKGKIRGGVGEYSSRLIGKSNLQTNAKKGEHLSLCLKKDPPSPPHPVVIESGDMKKIFYYRVQSQ